MLKDLLRGLSIVYIVILKCKRLPRIWGFYMGWKYEIKVCFYEFYRNVKWFIYTNKK